MRPHSPAWESDWRTLTACPFCGAWVHLVRDYDLRTRRAAPHARLSRHVNEWGEDCIMGHRPAPPWDEPTTRAAVQGRSMGVCEFCRRDLAAEMHHRKSRGVGGKWHPANIIHLCGRCHRHCTLYRDWGYLVHLLVQSHEDPAALPIELPTGELLWLSDEVTGGLNDPDRPTARDRATKRRHP